jgi:phage tail sheath protein FI
MPNNRLVRNQMAASLNAFMGELKRNGSIISFRPAIIDSSNNSTAAYFSRELYVSLQFQPLYSADYIYVTISRDTESSPLGE